MSTVTDNVVMLIIERKLFFKQGPLVAYYIKLCWVLTLTYAFCGS